MSLEKLVLAFVIGLPFVYFTPVAAILIAVAAYIILTKQEDKS